MMTIILSMNALSNILINQIFIIDMRASCEKEQPQQNNKLQSYQN